MPPIAPADAAATLRHAVAALNRRSAVDLGDLVTAVSPARTAAVADKLERAGALDADDVVTLDSWIRLADSATLHDDVAEAEARRRLAAQLREIRALVAPGAGRLSDDPRGA